jgi:hypothetical protein
MEKQTLPAESHQEIETLLESPVLQWEYITSGAANHVFRLEGENRNLYTQRIPACDRAVRTQRISNSCERAHQEISIKYRI